MTESDPHADALLARAFRRLLTEGRGDAALGRHLGSDDRPPRRFLRIDPGFDVDLTDAEAELVADIIDGAACPQPRPQPVEERRAPALDAGRHERGWPRSGERLA